MTEEELKDLTKELGNKKSYLDTKFLRKCSKEFFEQRIKNNIGASCFSVLNDNLLLWSHYSNNHKGICAGIDSKILFKATECSIGKVNYTKEYPQVIPPINFGNENLEDQDIASFFKILMTKNESWSYEHEYRIFKTRFANETAVIPKEAIKQIIIGCKFPSMSFRSLIDDLKASVPHADLFLAEMHPHKFELELFKLKYR